MAILDFDSWNEQKKKLDARKNLRNFSERDIFWCSIGLNVGDEEYGKGKTFSRPVLVLKKFNRYSFLGVPTSNIIKKSSPTYFTFTFKKQQQSALISQIRLFSAKRLENKRGRLPNIEFAKIKQAVGEMLGYIVAEHDEE